MRCGFVLLAAGRSRRLGFDKILTPLAGKAVLSYSLKALAKSEVVDEVVVVTREDIREQVETLGREAGLSEAGKQWQVIRGGDERQDSVHEGLRALGADVEIAGIHDAARPLLSAGMIQQLVSETELHGSAVAGAPATDTLKRICDADGAASSKVEGTLRRSEIWTVQTPQVFRKEKILSAYDEVQSKQLAITDDASAVEAVGGEVRLVNVGSLNLKITHPQDWRMLELWLQEGEGGLRQLTHDVCNAMSPLVGYLPLLEKYGEGCGKYDDYMLKVKESSKKMQFSVKELQERVRKLYPEQD